MASDHDLPSATGPSDKPSDDPGRIPSPRWLAVGAGLLLLLLFVAFGVVVINQGWLQPSLRMASRVGVVVSVGFFLVAALLLFAEVALAERIWKIGISASTLWLAAAVALSRDRFLDSTFYGTWSGIYLITALVALVASWLARSDRSHTTEVSRPRASRVAVLGLVILALLLKGLALLDFLDPVAAFVTTAHSLLASAWIGGLAGLTWATAHVADSRQTSSLDRTHLSNDNVDSVDQPDSLGTAVRRFSSFVALPSILVVALTGGVLLWTTGPHPLQLAKTVLLVLLVACGAVHRLITLPWYTGVRTPSRIPLIRNVQRIVWARLESRVLNRRPFVVVASAEIAVMIFALVLALMIGANRP